MFQALTALDPRHRRAVRQQSKAALMCWSDILHSPGRCNWVIDLKDFLRLAAHEEERDAEEGGNDQHDD